MVKICILLSEDPNADVSEANEFPKTYFKELFRLQGELVKLHDWVIHNKKK